MKYFISVVGMVMILEGLPYFAFPGKTKTWLETIRKMPESSLRSMGFGLMIAGLFLIWLTSR